MRRPGILLSALVACSTLLVRGGAGAADAAKVAPAGNDFTSFVDPRIGNVAPLLVPTYPTFSLPNQMLRMVPAKADYLEDQVSGFPLQVMAHRNPGILPMRVSLGAITPEAWKRKMHIDHDLEVVRPWHYSTFLIDDGIRVSFSPAKKAAIYKIDFPRGEAGNLLFSGTSSTQISAAGPDAFAIEEKVSYKTRGTKSVTRTMSVYCYGEIADPQGKPVPGIQIEAAERTLSITRPATAPASILLKYAVSYVSPEQAKKNFAAEVASSGFEDLALTSPALALLAGMAPPLEALGLPGIGALPAPAEGIRHRHHFAEPVRPRGRTALPERPLTARAAVPSPGGQDRMAECPMNR